MNETRFHSFDVMIAQFGSLAGHQTIDLETQSYTNFGYKAVKYGNIRDKYGQVYIFLSRMQKQNDFANISLSICPQNLSAL